MIMKKWFILYSSRKKMCLALILNSSWVLPQPLKTRLLLCVLLQWTCSSLWHSVCSAWKYTRRPHGWELCKGHTLLVHSVYWCPVTDTSTNIRRQGVLFVYIWKRPPSCLKCGKIQWNVNWRHNICLLHAHVLECLQTSFLLMFT